MSGRHLQSTGHGRAPRGATTAATVVLAKDAAVVEFSLVVVSNTRTVNPHSPRSDFREPAVRASTRDGRPVRPSPPTVSRPFVPPRETADRFSCTASPELTHKEFERYECRHQSPPVVFANRGNHG